MARPGRWLTLVGVDMDVDVDVVADVVADVVVVGAGPAGLMLAGELALAGVDVAVVERRPTRALIGSRAGGFHARTIEILDQRGIAERFLAEGFDGYVAKPVDLRELLASVRLYCGAA